MLNVNAPVATEREIRNGFRARLYLRDEVTSPIEVTSQPLTNLLLLGPTQETELVA